MEAEPDSSVATRYAIRATLCSATFLVGAA